jgi:dTMP kinase
MKINKPFFITIEGGEGVGKSSFIKKLSIALKKLSIEHILTREPGGTKTAETIRKIVNSPNKDESITIEAELLLISAARSQHIKHKIIPALNKNKLVLCDRFYDSTIVYQGMLGGIDLSFINSLNKFCTHNLLPNLTFLLDCPVPLALKRMTVRNQSHPSTKGYYDNLPRKKHEDIRKYFLKLAKTEEQRFVILNNDHSIDATVSLAIEKIKERL